MVQSRRSPVGWVLAAIRRFQQHDRVRAAEAAFLVVFLGGFYLLAFLRILAPNARGVTYQLLTSTSMEVSMGLTVVGPFTVVVLEWLSGLAQLRDQPGYDGWGIRERLYVWMEITNVVQNGVTLLYTPILPAALVWALVMMIQSVPAWPIPAAIALLDAVALVAGNLFLQKRAAGRLPPNTALHSLGEREGWI